MEEEMYTLLRLNNRMLRLLLKNQADIMVLMEEIIPKLNDDVSTNVSQQKKLQQIRDQLADIQYQKMKLQVKIMMADEDEF